jgi:hypothetical protein
MPSLTVIFQPTESPEHGPEWSPPPQNVLFEEIEVNSGFSRKQFSLLGGLLIIVFLGVSSTARKSVLSDTP